jgi:divalent metal cation (Fe/Co/Zn/Cd) transporter
VGRSPNLAITIFLYIAGILLVMMAVLLLLQSFGLLTEIPKEAVYALVLLAIGSGILAGVRRRG